MAAVQTDRATMTRLAERDPQVYHPLDRLRGIIRKYVVIEGVLSAALFVSVWFTLGLILDYGLFKTVGWDWVRDGAWSVRLLALVIALGLFAAILVLRIARRVNKEFSYSALALVLERKFPKVLGDRLITAVEMADVEAMGRFGYSKDMIRATIAEARERVGKVPVNEVFNWRRLWVMGFLAVGLLFATLVFSYASYFIATGSGSPVRFGWKFVHVTGIFAERNVALMDTPWPRRAHLEFVGFPENGELTVGRDAPPPRITARAYRWVIADRNSPDGWRPLVWADLNEELVGRRVPELPPSVLAVTSGGERTVDDVERWVYQTEGEVAPEVAAFRHKLREEMTTKGGYSYQEMQEVFVALAAKADQPSMGRTLRRLDVPAEVTYRYYGKKTAGSGTLSPQQNNEFGGEIAGLKEDVEFVVRGADYESGTRRIRLIPPPSLRRLARDQYEPAYLHHAPPQNTGYDALENRLQKVAAKDLSLTGERTVFVVPAGTQLTITGEAYVNDDKVVPETDRIVSAHVIPVAGRFPGTVFDDKARPTQTPVPLPVAADGSSFSISFKENKVTNEKGEAVSLPKPRPGGIDFVSAATNSAVAAVRKHTDYRLTENVEFKVVYVNKFNVSTTRSFLIQVLQDQAPTVEVAFDVIRKVGNEYLVTPMARIPFNPDSFIKDDRGLSKVEVAYTYGPEDSDIVRSFRVKNALRPLLDLPLPGATALPISIKHVDNFRALDRPDERLSGSVFLSAFLEQQKTFPLQTQSEFERLLQTARAEEAAPPAVKKVELKDPNRDYFDLDVRHGPGHPKAGERVFDMLPKPDQVQQIFRMELVVQATDNNVDADAGPRVTKNAELIRLKVVSESDLLDAIGNEQKQLAGKLDEALVKLAAAKKKYEFVRSQYDSVTLSRYERLRPNEQPDDAMKKEASAQLDAIKVRALDALQDVEKARDVVQSVVREFKRLTRECEVNRVNEAALTASRSFTDRLDSILRDAPEIPVSFPKTQALLTGVQNGINIMSDSISERIKNPGDRTPLAVSVPSVAVSDAEISLHTLERRLQDLRDEIGKEGSTAELKQRLKKIKEDQARIRADIIKYRADIELIGTSEDPTIGAVGVVSLNKGETKRVQHTIAWNQYKLDDLKVKVTASDPSVVVPGELNLNFERHTVSFDYEIKAGTKEGDFVVTLTPAKGKPVQVQVTVK